MSKWKLYKTARKRGIYAEIKKQNQAQALSKVPTNVQHFADLGVYKQLKKKTHLAGKDAMFPHLPPGAAASAAEAAAAAVAAVEAQVYKASVVTNNNNSPDTPNANLQPGHSTASYVADLQKKMFPTPKTNGSSNGSKDLIIDDDLDEEDNEAELEELEAVARSRAAAVAAAAAAAAADKERVSSKTELYCI